MFFIEASTVLECVVRLNNVNLSAPSSHVYLPVMQCMCSHKMQGVSCYNRKMKIVYLVHRKLY